MSNSGTYSLQNFRSAPKPFFCEGFREYTVYKLTNNLNGEIYIGVTSKAASRRFKSHIKSAEYGSHYHIHCAIRKYGALAFSQEILHKFYTITEAFEKEKELIAELKPKYNTTAGGEGVCGVPVSEENRKKSSERHKGNTYWVGRKHRPETLLIMRENMLGNTYARGKRTAETCAKIGAAKLANPTKYWLGKPRDQATKEKISKTKTGVPNPIARETYRKNKTMLLEKAAEKHRRPIVCLTTGAVFSCMRVVCEELGLTPDKVRYAIRHKKAIRGTSLKFAYEDSL